MEVFPQQFYENSSLWALTMKMMIFFAVSFDCLASSSSCYSSTTTIQGCLLFRGVKDVQRSNFQIPTQMIWSLVRNKKNSVETFVCLCMNMFLWNQMEWESICCHICCYSTVISLSSADNGEMSLWFSLCYDFAFMVSVTKYRADEWLMKPPTSETYNLILTGTAWTNKRKPKESNQQTAFRNIFQSS